MLAMMAQEMEAFRPGSGEHLFRRLDDHYRNRGFDVGETSAKGTGKNRGKTPADNTPEDRFRFFPGDDTDRMYYHGGAGKGQGKDHGKNMGGTTGKNGADPPAGKGNFHWYREATDEELPSSDSDDFFPRLLRLEGRLRAEAEKGKGKGMGKGYGYDHAQNNMGMDMDFNIDVAAGGKNGLGKGGQQHGEAALQ